MPRSGIAAWRRSVGVLRLSSPFLSSKSVWQFRKRSAAVAPQEEEEEEEEACPSFQRSAEHGTYVCALPERLGAAGSGGGARRGAGLPCGDHRGRVGLRAQREEPAHRGGRGKGRVSSSLRTDTPLRLLINSADSCRSSASFANLESLTSEVLFSLFA